MAKVEPWKDISERREALHVTLLQKLKEVGSSVSLL
jgi:hypothetical protein